MAYVGEERTSTSSIPAGRSRVSNLRKVTKEQRGSRKRLEDIDGSQNPSDSGYPRSD